VVNTVTPSYYYNHDYDYFFYTHENVRISFTPFGWTVVNRQLDRAVSFLSELGKHLVNIYRVHPGLPLSLSLSLSLFLRIITTRRCQISYTPDNNNIVGRRRHHNVIIIIIILYDGATVFENLNNDREARGDVSWAL